MMQHDHQTALQECMDAIRACKDENKAIEFCACQYDKSMVALTRMARESTPWPPLLMMDDNFAGHLATLWTACDALGVLLPPAHFEPIQRFTFLLLDMTDPTLRARAAAEGLA